MPKRKIVLAEAHQKLCATYGPFSYSRLWRGVTEARIEAERVGSRWLVDEADLPRVAEALGLTRRQPIAA